ncbi:Uncharacterized protein APZ42_033500 [Daphnia magna]|uniref:Uncharacterized protein n=1 Tax=Daphnia magna TaxID=35525 RepID=A0A164L153_9CRUS|nr:Uncharacterized protein APZ42_033500 [Daphnia magna]
MVRERQLRRAPLFQSVVFHVAFRQVRHSRSPLSHLSIEKGEEKYRRYIQYTQRLFAFFGSLSRAKEFPFRLASLLFIRLTMFPLSCRSNNRRCESTSISFSTILLLLFGDI